MIYKHQVFLRNGVPIDIVTENLPQLSEESLLHFERPSGELVTFVLESVAYWTTKGEQ